MPKTVEELEKESTELRAKIEELSKSGLTADQLKTELDTIKSQYTQMAQRNASLEETMQVMIKDREEGKKPAAAPDPVTDPDGYADYVAERSSKKIESKLDEDKKAEKARQDAIEGHKAMKAAFFSKYPHLADFFPIVQFYSVDVLNDRACAGMTTDQGFAEVAKRCDLWITEHNAKSNKAPEPPHVGPGGPTPTPPAKPKTPEPVAHDPDKETDGAIAEMRANQARASGLKVPVKKE